MGCNLSKAFGKKPPKSSTKPQSHWPPVTDLGKQPTPTEHPPKEPPAPESKPAVTYTGDTTSREVTSNSNTYFVSGIGTSAMGPAYFGPPITNAGNNQYSRRRNSVAESTGSFSISFGSGGGGSGGGGGSSCGGGGSD